MCVLEDLKIEIYIVYLCILNWRMLWIRGNLNLRAHTINICYTHVNLESFPILFHIISSQLSLYSIYLEICVMCILNIIYIIYRYGYGYWVHIIGLCKDTSIFM